MQNNPLVSVICLSYNHASFVVDALESVLNQSYANIELIIADDCSTDNSKAVIEDWLKKHPNILFLPNDVNLGNTKTFNNAAKHAKGNYFIDLAADDILLPNCVELQIKAFQNSDHTNLGIVYANINLVNENGKFISVYYNEDENPESGDIYEMVISRSTKICSVASMIKKEVFETVGYYDESLAYEDLDLWVRASRIFNFEYIPKVLAQKRELPTSLSAHFSKKNNKITKHLHLSTLKIFEKIISLNKTKKEHEAVLGRMKFEMYKLIHSRSLISLIKLFILSIKAKIKSVF
uniref:glycosyltransferase family 2 protein n=1 Tax=Flavobacterium sp. TaxID=239 RepID=UPI004049E02D